MRHPSEGVLRRLVDEPAGVADADRDHVAGCGTCLTGLATVRTEAAGVATALRVEQTAAVDVDTAWQRLRDALPARSAPGGIAPGGIAPVGMAPARRRSAWLRRPVIAAVGVALLLAGGGVAAAADWFPVFHTERIAAVTVSSSDLVRLPDLTSFGEVRTTGTGRPETVADAAAAHERTGLAVPRVRQLPRGVTGTPALQVFGQVSGTFTFSAARAASAVGGTLPPMPAGLDGSSIRLTAGPGVAEVWMQGGKVPALVVGRAVAPSAYSSGVPFDTMRGYLLSLPGLPADVAAQLRSFTPDASTLPLPIPSGVATSSTADVDGQPATLVTSRDGTMNGVVWAQGGTITVVAGPLSADEVLGVARGLR